MGTSNLSLEHLNDIKLRLYQACLMIACVVLSALYWQLNRFGPLNTEERFILPVMLTFCTFSLIFLKIYKQRYLAVFEFCVCVFVWIYDWTHFWVGLNRARLMSAPIGFNRFLIWLPILYVLFFCASQSNKQRWLPGSSSFLWAYRQPIIYGKYEIAEHLRKIFPC